MLIDSLPEAKKKLIENINAGIEEEKYSVIQNKTLDRYLETLGLTELKFKMLLFSSGESSGMMLCEDCAEKQQRSYGHKWFSCSEKKGTSFKISIAKMHIDVHHGAGKPGSKKRRFAEGKDTTSMANYTLNLSLSEQQKEEIINLKLKLNVDLGIPLSTLDSQCFKKFEKYLWMTSTKKESDLDQIPMSARKLKFHFNILSFYKEL